MPQNRVEVEMQGQGGNESWTIDYKGTILSQ